MTAERRVTEGDARPALVMLHGFALDARMWRRQVDALADDYRVLTIDLPGFGPQAREAGDVDPAAELARAMDASGLMRAHLVGNSYGAAVAVDFALRFPKRVQSLTLSGPLLLGRHTGIDSWARCVALAGEGDRGTAVEIWLDDPLFDNVREDEELFEELRQIVLDYGGGHWVGTVNTVWGEADPVRRLGEIQVPALVLSGEGDLPSFMLMAEAYAKGLPRARREIVQGAGHLVNFEQPEIFEAVLRDFLRTV